jgi:hypothetical protein
MIWRSHFVHCVLARTSPVAVRVALHSWSATRARDEASGVGQGMTEAGIVSRRCVSLNLEELSSAGTLVAVTASCYSHY